MAYSDSFKERMIEKMLGPHGIPVAALAAESEMHLLETHAPYTGFNEENVARTPHWTRYERSILGMDKAVEQFYRKAEQLSDRDILWVFVSDQGRTRPALTYTPQALRLGCLFP